MRNLIEIAKNAPHSHSICRPYKYMPATQSTYTHTKGYMVTKNFANSDQIPACAIFCLSNPTKSNSI